MGQGRETPVDTRWVTIQLNEGVSPWGRGHLLEEGGKFEMSTVGR